MNPLGHRKQKPGPSAVNMPAQAPIVVIEINGGVLNIARSSVPMRVVVLDSDIEGGDPANVHNVMGEDVYLTDMLLEHEAEPGFPGVAPEFVDDVLSQIDPAPASAESAHIADQESHAADADVRMDLLCSLLEEVRQSCTRDDDLPDGLLSRIDAALDLTRVDSQRGHAPAPRT